MIKQGFKNIVQISKNEILSMARQPIYYILTAGAAILIYFSKDFTIFTFDWGAGDDANYARTMIREMGLASMFMVATFMAIITASHSIFEEIEHKTALITLSKPVTRTQFILGKYFGMVTGTIPMFLFLGIILFLTIRFQSVEVDEAGWDFEIFKGVFLNFLKTGVLTALSVAVSTRLPFLANIIIVFTAFIICHLVNFLNTFLMKIEGILYYFFQFLYAITLNLENYNYFYQGDPPPYPSIGILGLVTLYTIIYSAIFLIIADISFAKRDLF